MKTPGELAYEADVAARPLYPDGLPRRAWHQLHDAVRWSWERNPTPRHRSLLGEEERKVSCG